MSIVLAGNSPLGTILVSDAMVTKVPIDQVQSFNDCHLQMKITKLDAFNGACTLVGDQIIENAIIALDNHALYRNQQIDFQNPEFIKDCVLKIAEQYILLFREAFPDYQQPEADSADLYVISPEKVFEFSISRVEDRYTLVNYYEFPSNHVVVNYGGNKFQKLLTGRIDQALQKAAEIIQSVHDDQKKGKKGLRYDLDNRFCGIHYPLNGGGIRKYLSPFRNSSEYSISSTGLKPWDLINRYNVTIPENYFFEIPE